VNFTPIGSSGTPFTGRFEGDDHTIVNLAISAGSTTDVGLFGATSNAVLANFGLVNPSVTGSQNVGAAVGLFNGGSMDSVYTSAGSVTGITNVGGLIGNIQAGTVSNLANFSVASATVSNVGGLVGNNSGTILTSFSQGFVSGGASPGGLVGVGAGTVTSSYWDNQTSGQPTLSAGGLGVATSTLQGGLPGGFSAGTWSIIAGTSYPYLTIFNTSQPRILSGNATTTGGHPVYLANNGSQVDTANTGANGYFYFQEHNGTLTGGSPYLIYQNNGGSSVGNLLGLLGAGNASTTTLSLSPGFIKVNGGPVTGFTTTDMATVAGSLSDVNILYSVSGSNLTLGNATHPNVTFQASGAGGFTINHVISSTGTTTALDMSAPVTINSTGVTTTGSQSYTDSVILNASSLTTLTSSNGAGISFSDTVNGPQGLSIGNGSGAISFSNFNVGGTSALASLSIGTGDTTAINITSIRTSGAQTYNSAVNLGAGSLTTLTSTGAGGISFGSTVNGPQGLSIANGSGAVSLGGILGGTSSLASLLIGTGNTTALNTTSIRTSGSQTYNSAVNLGAGSLTTLTSTGAGGVSFGSTLNGPQGLSIANSSGAVSLGGVVGGTSSLASLLIGTGDTTALNATGITTSGAQTYNSAVNLGAGSLTTLASTGASGITFGSTLNGPQGLSIGNSSGAVSFAGVIGGSSSLASLLIGSGDTTAMNTNTVTTSGSQTYDSAVNLGFVGLTTFTTNAGNISLIGALTGGAQSLTLTGGTGGDHVFALDDVVSIGTLNINGNASVANTIDFSGYVVPIVLTLSPPSGNVFDSGSLVTNTSSPIGSFGTIQTAIGTNTGQSVLVLPDNVPGISVTYTNPAHTSGTISDPFTFINFAIANPPPGPAPTPTPTPTPEPGPTPVDINFIGGTTAFITNNKNMEIINDGVDTYYDYFESSPWVNQNIDSLIKQQDAMNQYQTTKLTCYATSLKDPELKDCRIYPVRRVSEL
ncbi:MAG TPA: hypothetical protein VLJ15_06390, partial [Gammaproteobacteria bacterium]|nr:hypothetical protein [Gammaproteobacteria bacterium]